MTVTNAITVNVFGREMSGGKKKIERERGVGSEGDEEERRKGGELKRVRGKAR